MDRSDQQQVRPGATPNPWVEQYLEALCARPQMRAARGVAPLWLADEPGMRRDEATPAAARLTIQMAAEVFPRLVVTGAPGAGKTTTLRQLAFGMAESLLAAPHPARGTAAPLPLYLELALFDQSIEATLARMSGSDVPNLDQLAAERPLLLLLDGLDELAPDVQLTSLAALAQAATTLGSRARWIYSCRSENLPLFRPWLGAATIRALQPLRPADVLTAVQRQRGDEAATWLRRSEDLLALATRPRWLATLLEEPVLTGTPPVSRGRLLAGWIPATVQAAVQAHSLQIASEAAVEALSPLVAIFDQQQREVLSVAETHAALGTGPARRVDPALQLAALHGAALLTVDAERQQVAFRHPILRSFAQGMLLAQMRPERWPATIFGRTWADAVIFAYSICSDREAVLRRLLASGAVTLAARCLIDAEPAEQFEALLARSGTLTPPLRVLLADAFAAEGLRTVALEQLERAGTEGYDEAGLFGRLGELYCESEQWRLARAAYEQALLREEDDLRYRQQLGVVCSRLGEYEQAAAALELVLDAHQRHSAQAAHELGHVYTRQGQIERALAAYQQAMQSRPAEALYRRSTAVALRSLGRMADAEGILRTLLREQGDDPATLVALGQTCLDAGRHREALDCYTRAVALQPGEADLYERIGTLRRTLGDLPGARAALQRAIELEPDRADLFVALGQAAEACREDEAALAAYRHAARIDPHDDRVLRRLGALLRQRGEDEAAAATLRAALDLRPENADTHAELAALLWQQGKRDLALAAYQRAAALAPGNPDHARALGVALQRSGQLHEAERQIKRAAELAGDRADLQHEAALAAAVNEHWEAALAHHERAIELAPDQPLFLRAAAALLLKRDNTARARMLLARALRHGRTDRATHYQIGLLHSAAANWSRAIRALQRAAAGSREPHYFHQLGRALLASGRAADATRAFEQSLQWQPDAPETLHDYSCALEALGRFQTAYNIARHAAQFAGGSAAIQHHAGRLALRLDRRHEALELLDRATALDSSLADAHLDRARVLLSLDQPQPALAGAQLALAIDADLADAALLAGQALAQLKRADEAIPLLEHALARQPDLLEGHALLRDLLDRAGRFTDALASARRVIDLAPGVAEHHLRLGELLASIGEHEAAGAALNHAVTLAGSSEKPAADAKGLGLIGSRTGLVLGRAHAAISGIHAFAGDWSAAREHAERSISLDPIAGEHHAALAQALDGLGDLPGAIVALTAAIERQPDHAGWQHDLGMLLRRAGDSAAALPRLRRATQLREDATFTHDLALCLVEVGDLAEAIGAYERALRLRPDANEWRVELAELQARRGWHGEAVAELDQAIAAGLPRRARGLALPPPS
ncbi:MAG TPA: tetratricopeptide repeat protein, partial [Roseiflexaceae bacterium]|nr:tetratricopeptide repeat protein [Roseiflexaceae bacterium]